MINFCFKLGVFYWNKYNQFIKYCIIGVTGASLDFVIFTIMTHFYGIFYQYANVFSVTLGITNNFFLNVFFNFKKQDKLFLRFISFYGVGLFGLALSALTLHLLVNYLYFELVLSKLVTIFLVTIVQYTLNKIITFKTYE